MLCIWWNQQGVVYYKLQSIIEDRYRLQLMRLNRALKKKGRNTNKVILQRDNARPHVAEIVKIYLEMLKWEILPHLPYSPDIVPSDYHLFDDTRPFEQKFFSYEDIKK